MSGIDLMQVGMSGGRFVGAMGVGDSGGGNYGYVVSTYGTLTSLTFIDTLGNTRTIKIWNWSVSASGSVGFRLNGTSISNSDSTFVAISVNGRVLTRASATYTANDGGGRTLWSWSADTSAYPSAGTVPVSVI